MDQRRLFRHLPPDHDRPPPQRERRISPDARRCGTARRRRAPCCGCRSSSRLRTHRRSERDCARCTTRRCWITRHFTGRAWLAVELHRGAGRCRAARDAARARRTARPAAGRRRRRAHARARTARAAGCHDRDPSRHARSPKPAMRCSRTASGICAASTISAGLYPPELLAETLRIAALCTFDLRRARLRISARARARRHGCHRTICGQLTYAGAARTIPEGISDKVRAHAREGTRADRNARNTRHSS